MPTRRWDPGIGDEIRIGAEGQQGKNQELSEWRFSSNLTRFDWVSGKGNFGIFWPVWVIKWSTISIIIKTKSREFTGMVEMITTVDSQVRLEFVIRRLCNSELHKAWERWNGLGVLILMQSSFIYIYSHLRSQYSPRKEWGCDIVVMTSTRRSQWKYMGVYIGLIDCVVDAKYGWSLKGCIYVGIFSGFRILIGTKEWSFLVFWMQGITIFARYKLRLIEFCMQYVWWYVILWGFGDSRIKFVTCVLQLYNCFF